MVAIAFDAGGATTGIVTSPFLLALSSGIANNKNSSSNSDNFGVIGIASTGPILAVAFLSLITKNSSGGASASALELGLFLEVLMNAVLAIVPLVFIFFIFDICFLKIPKKQKMSLVVGCLITFVGLFLFLFGIELGMMQMGTAVGQFLSTKTSTFAIVFAIVIGFLITFAEPAVKVLGGQVEEVTQGNIKKSVVIVAIAIAMMSAISIFVVKIIFDISIWWILGIGYGLILILMPFSSSTFVAIAFDSGGVASGPMCAAFILPMMIGFASSSGSAVEGFGLIATVGMMPILVLVMLGVLYKIKVDAQSAKEYRKALRISYGIDMLSNVDKLEEEYTKRKLMKLEHEQIAKEYEKIFEMQLESQKEEGSGSVQG